MINRAYYGYDTQFMGVEEHRLIGGKGDGMRLFEVRNGSGLEFTVSADRAADISRLSFKGIGCSYMSPCGYVAPAFYEREGFGFLKSFNCGFLTTCGMQNIGVPAKDGEVTTSLHGTVSHLPADRISYTEEDGVITLQARVVDAEIFKQKLELYRTIRCENGSNHLTISDRIKNCGSKDEPFMMLYHMNIGYPLLCENTLLETSAASVLPRDARAAEGADTWNQMLAPIPDFQEQCYYHIFGENAPMAKVFNPACGIGLVIRWNPDVLPMMTEWKMMGERDYVLGLEPCSNLLNGRDAVRESGKLKLLAPGESLTVTIDVEFFDDLALWKAAR